MIVYAVVVFGWRVIVDVAVTVLVVLVMVVVIAVSEVAVVVAWSVSIVVFVAGMVDVEADCKRVVRNDTSDWLIIPLEYDDLLVVVASVLVMVEVVSA
jgi:hypothetical protein